VSLTVHWSFACSDRYLRETDVIRLDDISVRAKIALASAAAAQGVDFLVKIRAA
jgi:hypothetical protein